MRRFVSNRRCGLRHITCAAALLLLHIAPAHAQSDYRQWGLETLTRIRTDLYLPSRGLYADGAEEGRPPSPDRPAFMWSCGVQLAALAAAARLDPSAVPSLRQYASSMDIYWSDAPPTAGYDVLPGPKSPDRYYDDNVWIVLALCDAYEVTRDAQYLRRARDTFRFVMSGQDDRLDGGLYWHEQDRSSKNACVNGPAAAAAARLYLLTGIPDYLQTAKSLYDWTRAHLQDKDGLFFDNVRLDGKVERAKWSYNTALMLRASCLLYQATGDRFYLDAAEQMADAARMRWIDTTRGGISDGGQFAYLLCEAFLALYDVDHASVWLDTVRRALTFVHGHVQDANGHYANRWDAAVTAPLAKFSLIDQASAARAYLVLARYPEPAPK